MQYYEFRSKFKKCVCFGLVVLLSIFFFSCAANRATPQDVADESDQADISETKLITDISTEEDTDAISVNIKGNRLLTYTSVKQPLPMGLVLYFPETSLGMGQTEYETESDIIGTIKAAELIEDGPSKITIAMKVDAAYQITREGNGLKISFSKISGPQEETASGEMQPTEMEEAGAEETFEEVAEAEEPDVTSAEEDAVEGTATAVLVPVDIPAPEAPEIIPGVNNLHAIRTDYHENSMDVIVQLDRMVQDYKMFTLKNPARIVFDLYGIKSTYKGQQTVAIGSQWVKQVRHFAYPEKVRVVMDVEDEYINSYVANPSAEGLTVQIGSLDTLTAPAPTVAGTSETMPVMAAAPVPVSAEPEMSPEMDTVAATHDTETAPEARAPQVAHVSIAGPAFVNKIDFLSKDNGKSSIVIGTTRPVQYNLDSTDDKKLRLELSDTKIMKYRQRPLITTRFESAVDRIIPVQTEKMGSNSRIVIELREAVAYNIDQSNSQITIDFHASSIAPKPFEDANLPPWKTVMEEEAKAAEEKLAMAEPTEPTGPEAVTEPIPEIAAPEAVTPPVSVDETAAPEEILPEDLEEITPPVTEEMAATEDIPLPEGAADFAVEEPESAVEEVKQAAPKKRYTGEKIALDFYQTDIKNVLRILRDVSGRNFAIDKDVSGQVTLTLVKPVPWDQVLDLILRMNGLGQISEGEIVRIVTVATLRKEEQMRAEELKAQQSIMAQEKALEPLITEYIPINYANAASDIQPRLKDIITPERGNVGVDSRNNQIIITDTADKIAEAKELIRTIDKVTPQVIIEARVVEVSETFTRNLGTAWGLDYGPVTQGDDQHNYAIAMEHGVSPTGTIGYTFERISGTLATLDATLYAAEATGDGKIISTPKIVTLDNKAATISQGVDYPYFEKDSTGGGTSVKFKSVTLSLNVTPHVTPDNRVALKINVAKNDIGDFTGGVPSVTTNSATTELLVNDSDTVVIGGIIKTNRTEGYANVPWLNKIPFLGWLFKSKSVNKSKNELLIFITPKIVHLETSV